MRDMGNRGPEPKVSDTELLSAIAQDERPFSTVSYVAEEVCLSANRVRQRLGRLSEDGDLVSGEVARNIKIYWREEDELSS